MGFLDKAKEQAKQLADQAQKKIDEAQDKFNERQQQSGSQPSEGAPVTYDEHGRPVEKPAAAEAPPPTGEPAAPTTEETGLGGPHGEPGPPAEGEANKSPDPFKPIEP